MEGITVKFLRQGICLLVLGGGLAAVPGLTANASPAPAAAPDNARVTEMRQQADGRVAVTTDKATGKVTFIRVSRDGDLHPSSRAGAAAKAQDYLAEFAPAFGAPARQLREAGTVKADGGTTVSYTQEYQGVPVFGSLLRVHLDAQGDLTAVNGELVPVGDLSTAPRFSASEAAERALAEVKADPPAHENENGRTTPAELQGLEAAKTTLVVYRHGLVQGIQGKTELAYQVEVTNHANVRDMVFISAQTGKAVNRYSMMHSALDREFYEVSPEPGNLVWEEGDELPGSLNEDQESMVRSTGDAYWFFKNAFGRDSYDGNGATMKTVNNDPRINCPNANWNGVTTNYCDGVSSDDVVAHEWGHAYTEYTHGLIYQWQSGALNESYSDIWGETVDLLNGRLDGDEGDLASPRPVGACSTHSPALPTLTINAPASIAKDCDTGGASFGPQLDSTGVTGEVVMALDADEDGDSDPNPFDLEGSIYDGCSAYTNAGEVTGKIVMVNRGLCGFEVKARNADAAGAIGVIIANRNDHEVFTMSGDAEPDPTISSVMIDKIDRTSIADALTASQTVSVTMKDAGGARTESFKWLMGEDSDAFGGAIRDMWNPNCYGDPGKVSDAQYVCSSDDGGGVHSNSGVPNHGYALLVDGGTYNGVEVGSIGLTKAAAIYYKAMTEYQTPASNFVDHADSLEASCAELTGKALKELSTDANDSQVALEKITADDCAQVAAMTEAIELRLDPTSECDWHPILDPNAPEKCGPGFTEAELWSEDFEDGLDGWTLTEESAFGGAGMDWEAATNTPGDTLPDGHTGTAAFGPAPDHGVCDGSTDDFSTANFMTSEDIVVEGAGAPRLSFEHYVRTEAGYDGGNLRISVNGGDFEVVPASAFTFNAYNATMQPAPGNTSPLAGEPGFTGTDPGSPFGSWGESQVDLSAAGVSNGDTIQLQFAIGRDGCGGLEGWYVDNVSLVDCVEKAEAEITPVHEPEPAAYGSEHSLTVTVAGDGEVPTGTVTVLEGDTELGSASLAAGVAEVDLPTTMSVGSHDLTVEYSGDEGYKAGTGGASVEVVKATSTTTATPEKIKVDKGTTVKAKVTVTAPGLVPGGTVKIFDGTKKVGKGTLNDKGKVTIKLKTGTWSLGKHKLSVKYVGTASIVGSQDKIVVKVI